METSFVKAWPCCEVILALDAEGRVWAWNRNGLGVASLLAEQPIPGNGDVLVVSLGPPVTALRSGTRYMLSGGTWIVAPSLFAPGADAPARTLHLRALKSFSADGTHTLQVGDAFDLPEHEALGAIAAGRAELAEPQPVAS